MLTCRGRGVAVARRLCDMTYVTHHMWQAAGEDVNESREGSGWVPSWGA